MFAGQPPCFPHCVSHSLMSLIPFLLLQNPCTRQVYSPHTTVGGRGGRVMCRHSTYERWSTYHHHPSFFHPHNTRRTWHRQVHQLHHHPARALIWINPSPFPHSLSLSQTRTLSLTLSLSLSHSLSLSLFNSNSLCLVRLSAIL